MEEIWKPCPFAEESHMVSNLGRIKKLAHYRMYNGTSRLMPDLIMALQVDKYGYSIILITNPHIRKSFKVHRLVALAFIPNPENKRQINHIDGNKRNNNLTNIEWATQSENMVHSIHVLGNIDKFNPQRGEKSGKAKITEIQAMEIINSKDTRTEIAKRYGISLTSVHGIQTGKRWRHLHKKDHS